METKKPIYVHRYKRCKSCQNNNGYTCQRTGRNRHPGAVACNQRKGKE